MRPNRRFLGGRKFRSQSGIDALAFDADLNDAETIAPLTRETSPDFGGEHLRKIASERMDDQKRKMRAIGLSEVRHQILAPFFFVFGQIDLRPRKIVGFDVEVKIFQLDIMSLAFAAVVAVKGAGE